MTSLEFLTAHEFEEGRDLHFLDYSTEAREG